jgi:hypothetical protein
VAAGNHYSRAEVQEVLATCKDLGLEVSMPKKILIFYLAHAKGTVSRAFLGFIDINKKI